MSISQMMIAGSNLSAGGGGSVSKSVSWSGIAFEPIQEGQQQTVTVNFSNWDSSTAYWSLYDYGGNRLDNQVVGGSAYGTLAPGNGFSGNVSFNFTFNADASSEGQLNYAVRVGSFLGGSDYTQQGYFTLRDSSQTPTLVFDLDSANWGNGTWTDTSGNNLNAVTSNMGNTTDNGYTVLFNGSSTYANVGSLTNSVYGTITLSAWVKPTVINDRVQTIIAKELCYKLRLNTTGTLTLTTGKGYVPWEVTATVGAGTVLGGQWSHIVATVDASYTRIYVNGIKVTETSGNIIGANTSVFDIGAYSVDGNSTVADFFYGSMGEVKMWNYALTDLSILAMYNATRDRYGAPAPQIALQFSGSGATWLSLTQPSFTSTLVGAVVDDTGANVAKAGITTTPQVGWYINIGGFNRVISQVTDPGPMFNYYLINWSGSNISAPDGNSVTVYKYTSNWQLGSTYTIEAWTKEATVSSSTIRSIVSQGGGVGYLDFAYADQALLFNNKSNYGVAEPTPGIWTHVAIVGDGTNTKMYYDGTLVYTGAAETLTNAGNTLAIGRRGPDGAYQYFYGKITSLRINSTALYSADFIPTITPTPNSNDKLLLTSANPTIDSSPDPALISVSNVSIVSEAPHRVINTQSDSDGAAYGDITYLFGNPYITAAGTVPVGAKITSNKAGFGVRTVTTSASIPSGYLIQFDATGLTGTTSALTDIYHFYW